ncbi:MAG: DNA polymerase/3'-5' exonuclease PolX [Candidatus Omnitrophica bacterium]|nr:DNA polymerase/3'-5' exonuclease PolX [Candidatus Omnitrophota bacterium]
MPVHNSEIADKLNETADLLEIKGENQFRIRAYRGAARTIESLSQDAAQMTEAGKDLSELPGIGRDLAGKIKKIVSTGTFPLLDRLHKQVPAGLRDIMKVSGMGGKRVKKMFEALKVKNIDDLKTAARRHEIRELEGFGEKIEQSIIEGIERMETAKPRMPIAVVDEIARPLLEYLSREKKVKNIDAAGSYRRRTETVGDLDILVTCKQGSQIMDRFTKYENVEKVVSQGNTKSTVLLRSGFQVDLRVLPQVSYGSALVYFTGSKAHNVAIRRIALKKKLKMNEYGVFKLPSGRRKKERRIAGKSEKQVYQTIDLSYIPPELRENRGEVEAAKKRKLPKLIELDDIRGDLHVHTARTDGKYSLKDMVEAAQRRGYEYVGVTDHSKKVRVAHGMDKKRLREEIRAIDKLQKKVKGITILKGIEVDILEDGSLDLPQSVLKDLDFTVCSVHSKFKLSRKKQTGRVLKAMDNAHFSIFAHPTGRRINEREPYEIDIEEILRGARERNVLVELNAHPHRLDLNDRGCKTAKELGVKIVISTDAHAAGDLDSMRFGVGQARRGWLEKKDVANTRNLKQLRRLLKR